jgi:hypothetical protein
MERWRTARMRRLAALAGRACFGVEENVAADAIELSADQIDRLGSLRPAAGERHDEANMASIDR